MRFSLLAVGAAITLESMVLADRGSATPVAPSVCDGPTTVAHSPTSTPRPTSSPVPTAISRRRASRKQRRSEVEAPVSHSKRSLLKRGGQVTINSNCNSAPPAGSSYNSGNGFATMADVIQAAYNDAVRLAQAAQNVDANNFGFTHYFGGEQADVQLQHFQAMMQGVANSNQNYNIEFTCVDSSNSCSDSSVFVTDATVGGPNDQKSIVACPKFWTSQSSKFLLYDPNHTEPSPPYRDNTSSGWCQKRKTQGDANVSAKPNQFFATAGASVLHELTHLDSLATVAGLQSDGATGPHGTDDFQGSEEDTCQPEFVGAREFLQAYKDGQTGGTSPDYNAESYAAAASEIFFMGVCGFSQIKPFTPASS